MSTLFRTVGAVLCLVFALFFATPAKADSLYPPLSHAPPSLVFVLPFRLLLTCHSLRQLLSTLQCLVNCS
jgi:hypothetical protein